MEEHRTPEEAAMAGFPATHCRVVAFWSDVDDAYVLLDTGSAGGRYLYGVNCHRHEGLWSEGSSGNSGGWSFSPTAEGHLGTWALWDDAPTGADMVRVEFDGESTEHPIHDGVYLVAWFRRPNTTAPQVTAFRIDGAWVAPSAWQSGWFQFLSAPERVTE